MKRCVCLQCFVFMVIMVVAVMGQSAFTPPQGGWTYIYQGDVWASDPVASLDGLWSHENGSDAWDMTEINDGNPGGVSVLTETVDGVVTTFLRIQDTGNPTKYGMPDPSNRKIYLGYNISENDAPGNAETLLDDGITISFRSRVALPSETLPLDMLQPDDGSGGDDWPAGGDGYIIHDGGKGNFTVHQQSGGTISFCLAVKSDHPLLAEELDQEGLIMNRIGANVNWQGATIEDAVADVAYNVLPLDPRHWHEFWITIAKTEETADGGTHEVNVWVDGGTEPTKFIVTAGSGSDFSATYLAIGCGATPQSGAYDIDFVGYREGVYTPQSASAVRHSAPEAFALMQNYPNPFNPSTAIEYALPKDGLVALEVFDHLGRNVWSLVSELQAAGRHTARFNADGLANGIYFYRLSLDGQVFATRKMVLMK